MKQAFLTVIRSQKMKKATFLLVAFLCGVLITSFYEGGLGKKSLQINSFPTLHYDNFTLSYDAKNRIPLWAHEHLTQKTLEKVASRNHCSFSQDPNVYSLHQSSLQDYKQSGYDRGHMVPAADQQHSREALKDTFYLTNVCPQNISLNRGLWSSLERKTRSYVSDDQEVDVVTGPLFLSHKEGNIRYVSYQVLGENEVAVPTHFFKLIHTRQKTVAYIIPNKATDPNTSLETFQVSIKTLEKVSGLHFKFT